VQEIEAAQLIGSVIEEFRDEYVERNVLWQLGELPILHGDLTLVRLVFQNLVGNALKFTRGREEAVIQVQAIDGLSGETGVLIRDNGAGFDPAYGHKLFGVFQRLHREEEFEGTGIGLANVQRIVSRHGGRVWAEGRLGEGATFFVVFPKVERRMS
jgi:light-regulated signal transduction histidine kinase (bacteriophytochrome)